MFALRSLKIQNKI